MTLGMCRCVCCVCSVMREGMCKRNTIKSGMNLMVWGRG